MPIWSKSPAGPSFWMNRVPHLPGRAEERKGEMMKNKNVTSEQPVAPRPADNQGSAEILDGELEQIAGGTPCGGVIICY